jgi:oxygen-independent coproporphyrinogen-3 oxidase
LIGIYVHIPFCAAICSYCNFNRGLLDEPLKRRYVEALAQEIQSSEFAGAAADTIFFGGGTPSLLSPEEIQRLICACRAGYALDAGAEITLEANPETVTPETLEGFRAAGINRISFGVQSFREDELKRLGRLHSVDTARRAVSTARAAGFDNLSLDLMMWLPGQSTDHWLESVAGLIDTAPDHASLYLLEVYPNSPLKDDMARAGWSLAPDEDAEAMYLTAMERLETEGFHQYEISNVARPGREARHNLKYWTEGEWLGFGCGAHATCGGQRWRVVSGTAEYVEKITSRQDVRLDLRSVDAREQFEEAMFMGLRLTRGVDLAAIRERHGVDVWGRYGPELEPFLKAGLLIYQPDSRLALTRRGMLVASELMMVFIGDEVR